MLPRLRPLLAALTLLACSDPPPPAPTDAAPDHAVDASIDAAPMDAADGSPDAADAPMRCDAGTTFCGEGCVNVRTDPAHCGRCERSCATGEDCMAGACVVRCQPTETRCADRCVDARTDRANCGACGRACPMGEVCSMGDCTPDCAAGFATCTRTADGGAERFCADTRTDRAHCGMCNAPCPTGEVCAAGACRPDCRAGETVCSPPSGPRYCATLPTDNSNCGACGNTCTAGTSCMAGRCLQVCTATQTRCGDTCHDLTADQAHCGMCGRACVGEERCLAGRCRVPCRPGFADCNEVCVALATDANHCGGCGVRCRLPHVTAPRCLGGGCAVGTCEPGWSDCNGDAADGCEVNTGASDPSHCGGCGVVCAPPNAVGVCAAGRCTMGPCAPAWVDCDGMAANGCEVNTLTDDAHCGACSRVGDSRQCARGLVCAQGTCAAACNPGTTNCANDCVSLARDPRNCGACGRFCALANVEAQACVAGGCAVGRCAQGFGDCDGVATNGCEVALSSDLTHCGACGRACRFANAAATCAMGACRMGACAAGFADCDGDPSNGCEVSTATDPAHCGACSVAGAPRACAAGEVCAAGVCGSACAAGAVRCGERCVDPATDAAHCGGCDRACRLPGAQVTACVGGACAIARCATGAGDCNGAASDGCEEDLTRSLTHCGACGRACRFANAAASCDGGACRMGACEDGWADCDRDPTTGCEVNLRLDPAHCGACSAGAAPRGCPAGQVCSVGVCRAACDMGTVACDGLCIDVTNDRLNCGACRAACNLANATSSCVARTCRVDACRAGFLDCDRSPANGCEVAVSGTDRLNCGACGRVCTLPNAAGACVAGACVPGTCAAGFGDCDGTPTNGCEARLAVDGNHCGMCGRRCAAGQVCAAGACVAACPAGAMSCSGSCRDVATDIAACGACGAPCAGAPNAFARCLGGACGVTCATGWGNCDGVADNGCERRLDGDTDCGACGRVCALPHALSACTATGACAVVACDAGWANCDANPANGCEVDLNTDSARCGACTGRACAAGQLCQAGACVAACATGRIRCGNGCVDPTTDALHCGSCGAECPARAGGQPACARGVCGVACVAGRGDCNDDPDDGCETDVTTRMDCGACGRACAAGEVCVGRRCVTPAGYRAVAPPSAVGYVDACAAPGATRVMFGRAESSVSAVAAPFAFPFWGETVAGGASLTVSTNGYLRVGSDMGATLSGVIPSLAAPNGLIAPHWGDVSVRSPQVCVAVTGSAPTRQWIVAWPDATYYDGAPGAHLHFEVIVTEGTGVIDLAYGAMTGARYLTTGLESPDGRSGARPPGTLFRTCVEATGNNCRPEGTSAYRFIPSI
jgi:hypothetical protein